MQHLNRLKLIRVVTDIISKIILGYKKTYLKEDTLKTSFHLPRTSSVSMEETTLMKLTIKK